MIVLGFFIGLIIVMQILILVGICRTNNKLNELESKVSTLNDLIVPYIGMNSESILKITHILDQMADAIIDLQKKQKKHKKEKGENKDAGNDAES